MPIVEDSIDIATPRARVYQITQDYSVRFDWDPFPDRLEVIGGGDYAAQVGTRVLVRSRLGMEMVVEFVNVDPPGRASIAMVSGPALLKKFAGSWIFDELEDGRTHARFRYLIQGRKGLLKPIVDAVAVVYFRRVVRKRLAGLKQYCER
ncbi:SRPBCC family protein [Chitinimonas arctica]|uniref:SRPBCC family protein n=1 Tax=Chitinimonas arctica TaxID=2594795 RepID=A0A516SBH1_9NEIS|nr:SRPBCC family protein [Chitinimonas arctica]QDQ25496.1 SRPBCC family protein [Chitinimonas arctica]